MISCDSAKNHFSDYIEDRLNPEHKKHIEEHLAQCESCRTITNNMMQMRSIFSDLSPKKSSENFYLNLRRRINQETISPGNSRINLKTISFGFSFALILIVSIIAYNNFIVNDAQNLQQSPVIRNETTSPDPVAPANKTVAGYENESETDLKTVSTESKTDSSKSDKNQEQNPRIKYVDTK